VLPTKSLFLTPEVNTTATANASVFVESDAWSTKNSLENNLRKYRLYRPALIFESY
jgi:hypothetical protein